MKCQPSWKKKKIITWSLSAAFCGSVWVISYVDILYHEHCATLGQNAPVPKALSVAFHPLPVSWNLPWCALNKLPQIRHLLSNLQ